MKKGVLSGLLTGLTKLTILASWLDRSFQSGHRRSIAGAVECAPRNAHASPSQWCLGNSEPAASAATSLNVASQKGGEMFRQLLTPVGDSLGLSFLVAILPVVALLVLLGLLRRPR